MFVFSANACLKIACRRKQDREQNSDIFHIWKFQEVHGGGLGVVVVGFRSDNVCS